MKDAQQKAAKMGDSIRRLYVVGGDAFAVLQNDGEIFRYNVDTDTWVDTGEIEPFYKSGIGSSEIRNGNADLQSQLESTEKNYDEVIRIAREMAHEAINQTRGNINRKAKEALKRLAEITGEKKHG